jgi:hypothetical protein
VFTTRLSSSRLRRCGGSTLTDPCAPADRQLPRNGTQLSNP